MIERREQLKIAVIGAGIGGLTAALALAKKGFSVDVYEAAHNLGFVGAGIQIAPNAARVLDALGCWQAVEKEATCVRSTSIRQGSTNDELTHVDMPDIEAKFGYPHVTPHRETVARTLYQKCLKEDRINFHFGSSLTTIHSFEPEVQFSILKDDVEHQSKANILIGADGIKSVARASLLHQQGLKPEEVETGQAAYRIMLKRDQMAHDPEMMSLLDSDQVVRWVGERKHVIAYPIANKSIYNISTVQPDRNFAEAPSVTYTTRGSKGAMMSVFSDFCPLVQRMLDLVADGEVCEWRLRMYKPLRSWTFGNLALIGDACHPTLPHLGQGAAMAMEDACVIAEILDLVDSLEPDRLVKCMRFYEQKRKDWCSNLVEMAYLASLTLHLGDGQAKEERDRQFRERESGGEVPDKWASPDVQQMIYSNDCIMDIRKDFQKSFFR